MTAWVLYVPMDVPSENQLLRGKTVRARIGKRKHWRALSCNAFRALGFERRIPDARGKRRVTWERILGPRQQAFDLSNFIAGLKPIEDGLVDARLLIDDKPQFYEGRYGQVHDQRDVGPCLRVTIEELE